MKNTRLILYFLLLQLPLLAFSCKKEAANGPTPTNSARWVNLAHLNALFKSIKIGSMDVGIVDIYSEYPDYHAVTDADEGFTCVDDVARAVILMAHEPDLSADTDKRNKLALMTEFVLQMQAPDGYFYNFLWPDGTINTGGPTSINQPNFWSWRALWGLTEAYPYFKTANTALASRIQTATQKLVANLVRDFGNKPQESTFIQGIQVPRWLPFGSGTDQAAIILLGVLNYQQQFGLTADASLTKLMELMGEGIVSMQYGDAGKAPFGVILSFDNGWHAYASDQSYALLRAGKALNKPAWITVAKREVDNFYPYLLEENFLESFTVAKTSTGITFQKSSSFSQIAYGVRPMVWASLELYDQTKDAKYATQAGKLAAWFLGANPAQQPMYDVKTGRCFDGISSPSSINRNSGAESTIEALLAFQRIEQFPAVMQELEKYR